MLPLIGTFVDAMRVHVPLRHEAYQNLDESLLKSEAMIYLQYEMQGKI